MTGPAGSSQASRAYEELERRLVTLELAPGRFLLERDLVETLGFGRTPVREAIQRLVGQGLLKVFPRKGIQVEPLEQEVVARVIEARRVLERLLVVKAAERARTGQRERLRLIAGQLDGAGADAAAFFRLDRVLDQTISAASDNPFLVQALAPLHVHCRRLWSVFGDRGATAEAASLHARLARAVADASSAGAIGALNGIIAILETFQGRLAARS